MAGPIFWRGLKKRLLITSPKSREGLVDITYQVNTLLSSSGIDNGLLTLYVQGATAAMMINGNWDDSVQTDVVNLLRRLDPPGNLAA